ncbi:MAG: non-canonical purine NTP diphosphatase [Bacteroidales bacterium]|nr:non-canonical purine NTP diphosphatase [Bacteroidales bacterium]
MELVFASNNGHKLQEIKTKIGSKHKILSLKDVNIKEELPETSPTIEGNAQQKAEYLYNNYHHNCFADDTGLEIEALHGAPGVISARYAGPDCSAKANMDKVLSQMNGVENRKALFRTIICLIINNEKYFFEGIVKGKIALSLSGNEGFGYDPIFIPDGYDISFAEMSISIKNEISHRGKATKLLLEFLNNLD